jgi:DNA-binding protein HU-beta
VTKSELVAQVAKNSGVSSREAETVLNGFRDVVQASVKAGKDISYPGLGKFSRVSRKARTARNPRTGETLKVAATRVPRFVPSEGFKRIVKGEAPAPKLAR